MRSATDVYKAAVLALPKSLLVNFAYADHVESRGEAGEAKGVYEALIECAEDHNVTLVYIQYMRYLRRNDTTIKQKNLRDLFKRIRKDTRSTYHATIAYAFMELAAADDKKSAEICARVLKHVGMKEWEEKLKAKTEKAKEDGGRVHASESDTGFIKLYLNYRMHQPDPDNTRQLFERALSALPGLCAQCLRKLYPMARILRAPCFSLCWVGVYTCVEVI